MFEESQTPDPDLVDLIELALPEGQLDGQKADLAYLWPWNMERALLALKADIRLIRSEIVLGSLVEKSVGGTVASLNVAATVSSS